MGKYDDLTHETMLKDLEFILQNKDSVPEADYEEALQMKRDILNDIQKNLLESRRKKINKLMNIPEPPPPPMSEDKREKLERCKKLSKSMNEKIKSDDDYNPETYEWLDNLQDEIDTLEEEVKNE